MRLHSSLAFIAVVLATAATVHGQGQPLPPTTVQLPTFSLFTVQTTVSVPDGGGAYLGGIKRARDGNVTRGIGPLRNRGIGSERGASGVSVHARIIDHKEMDEALLAEAAARRGTVDPTAAKASALSRHISGSASESIAAIRERNVADADQRSSEAAILFAKAQQAEAEGKAGVAKIYYQMVARRDSVAFKEQAKARLSALASNKNSSLATR